MLKPSQINFTGDIHIQSMQRQSVIFIGERNNAIGWSTHSKENAIIGDISGQSNLFFNNIFIVNDPDIIDTPIDDRDINISFENPGDENISNLTLDSLNVNSMQNNSSISIGKGNITGMDANQKANFSQGGFYGNKNQFLNNTNINNDQDVLDGIIDDQDIKIVT